MSNIRFAEMENIEGNSHKQDRYTRYERFRKARPLEILRKKPYQMQVLEKKRMQQAKVGN